MRHLAVILPVTHLPARPVCPLPADGVRAGFHCPDTHHELGAASPHGVQAGIKANVVVIVTVTDVIEDTAGTAGLNAEPRQPGGCKLKTAPVRPVVAARPAEYVCSEDLFY